MQRALATASTAQRAVLVFGVVVLLLAIGYSLLPFSVDPRQGGNCGMAATAWSDRYGEVVVPPAVADPDLFRRAMEAAQGTAGDPTPCAQEARSRLWGSGVVIVLAGVGAALAFVILRGPASA